MKEKVVVGMSGGVDSSVAAYLLKEQGYDVIGVTMRMWNDKEEGCGGFSAVDDAKKVAESLDIPYYVMDFSEAFKKHVMDYFAKEYLHARTPNPCIVCNRYVKWEALLERSRELGADYIATGHYARIKRLENGRFAICNSATAAKDQTYALYMLTQDQLAHTIMPVGAYEKSKIREIAEKAGIPVAHKSDSQEICFVPDNDYVSFIKRYTGVQMPKGNFVDIDGNVLGQHQGLLNYTIGQRRGLNLPMGHRVFVKALRPDTNEVVIAENEDMFTSEVKCTSISFMGTADFNDGDEFIGKIRYGHKGTLCRIYKTGDDEITARFSDPVRAATPGQALVLYKDDYVALGGTIK